MGNELNMETRMIFDVSERHPSQAVAGKNLECGLFKTIPSPDIFDNCAEAVWQQFEWYVIF
jgi:hypothetical protein